MDIAMAMPNTGASRFAGVMTRQRFLLFAGLLAPALSVLVAHWLLTDRYRIRVHTYERLKVGMAKREVDAAIGFPPGSYRDEDEFKKARGWKGMGLAEGTLLVDVKDAPNVTDIFRPERLVHVWKTDAEELYVICDTNDRVRGFYYCTTDVEAGFWDRIRHRLGL
jgi:hypothetical protein